MQDALPRLALPAVTDADPRSLFPTARGAVLEIGFGGGEHLAAQARAFPDLGFIGVEPFMNGMASFLRHAEDDKLQNVRVYSGDAREIVAAAPDGAFDLIYILFPDPWPKKKHWKRRLVQPGFVGELARVLKPNGEIRFATDWKHYAATALEAFLSEPRLIWTAEDARDWRSPWDGHVTTRYEAKKLGDTAPIWLRITRVGEACPAPEAAAPTS
jgi:tRNA (guanine-N7-)-methyltransferase